MLITKWKNNASDSAILCSLSVFDTVTETHQYLGNIVDKSYLQLLGLNKPYEEQFKNVKYYANFTLFGTDSPMPLANVDNLEDAKAEFEEISLERVKQKIRVLEIRLEKLKEKEIALMMKGADK